MNIENLVGKVAIRTAQTVYGGSLFLCEPVLVLSATSTRAQVCTLQPSDIYDAGVTVCLQPDYMDSSWIEYGPLFNQSVQTKAQVIAMMLNILGITADKSSLRLLCQAISFKQLFSTIEDQLDLTDIINALRETDISGSNMPANSIPETTDTSWANLISGNKGGFVKRGFKE